MEAVVADVKTTAHNTKVFTAVLTPHFLKRLSERSDITADLIIEMASKFWRASLNKAKCYAELGRYFLVFRRRWDGVREKHTLVFVTFSLNIHPPKDAIKVAIRH